MKKILALAIVLLSLTACEDGVLFTLRGKIYIHWDDENRASTLNFSTNKKGVKNNWTNYNEGKLCPENMGAYTDFEYVLEYPKLKIIYNDSIEYNYIFAGEDLFQGNDEYNTDKYMRIE